MELRDSGASSRRTFSLDFSKSLGDGKPVYRTDSLRCLPSNLPTDSGAELVPCVFREFSTRSVLKK